jgi:hypothetical protein
MMYLEIDTVKFHLCLPGTLNPPRIDGMAGEKASGSGRAARILGYDANLGAIPY